MRPCEEHIIISQFGVCVVYKVRRHWALSLFKCAINDKNISKIDKKALTNAMLSAIIAP